MKNLLITGGCGFIGTNFIKYLLLEAGFEGNIINVDKLTYAGNRENLIEIEKLFPGQYKLVCADICNMTAMAEVFEVFNIDSVCHFAAESHVDRSILGPYDFIKTNILGTFNLLELCRLHKNLINRFHHISTDEVFGSLDEVGHFTEDTPYNPSSPYSASKAASDHLVTSYGKTYGIPITLSNCSNNYGPYQFPEKLIPLTIINALEGRQIPVYGNGFNVRDWLYVNDHCRAVLDVIKKGKTGQTYNIGGKCEMRNIDVVKKICDTLDETQPLLKTGPRRNLIHFVSDRPGHDLRYAIDFSKIHTELGWKPKENFDSGIKKTIQWYLDNKAWIENIKSGEYMSWIKKQYPEI